jgi:hypothetical protein
MFLVVELVVGGVAADDGLDREGGDGLGDREGSVVEGVDVAVALVEGIKVGVVGTIALVEGVKVGVVGAVALVEVVVEDNIVLDIAIVQRDGRDRGHLLGQLHSVLHRGDVLGVPVDSHAVDACHAETVAVAADEAGHGRSSVAGNSHQGDHVGLHGDRVEDQREVEM